MADPSGVKFRIVADVDIPTPAAGKVHVYWISTGARYKDSAGVAHDFPSVGSFNGRTGSVVPIQADYDTFFLTPAEGSAAFDALGAASGAVASHVALPDPHAQYQLESEKDAANGYAGLSAGTKLAGAQQTYGTSANTATEGNDARVVGAVQTTRSLTAGAGLTGGGDLSADRTFNVGANADGSISVAADTVGVGVLATDAQHGNRGGGAVHANSNATTAGFMSPAGFRKQRDQYTDIINDLGVDPTGAVDGTALVQAWINGLVTSGVLYIPAAVRCRIDGPVTVTKEIRVVGAERRTSIIGTGSATNTQFDVTADSVVFENLRFEAGTTAQNLALRSAGYCVDFDATSNGSGVYKVDVIGHWSAFNLEGQLPFVDDCAIREYGALAGNGACIRINTPSAGGDTYINRLLTDNGSNPTGWAGIRVINCASLVIEASNIIHATVGLAVEPPNAGTVPSIKCNDCFFDNGTHGVRFNPGGTGVWYRSEFVNCWMGSNTVAGVEFASAQFEGIEFTNCKVLGNPIGFDANAGGGKWTVNSGCVIAGSSTAGIRVAASANHFPMIQGCRVGSSGAFGVNAVGIIVGAGTYKGMVVLANDFSNNTSAITLGAVAASAGASFFRITGNPGINPRGSVGVIAVPGSGVARTNDTGFPVTVLQRFTVVPTGYAINGVATVLPIATSVFALHLEPGSSVTTTGGTYTWTWVGN